MRKKYKKFAAAGLVFLVVAAAVFTVTGARSKTKSYFSGDAIAFQGQLIIGSTNMGGIELFRLEGEHLARVAIIEDKSRLPGKSEFFDLHLSQEGDRLFVYAVDGSNLYRYDITEMNRITLTDKVKDNSFDWMMGVGKSGNKLATIGTNGIKYYDNQLRNISDYKIVNRQPRSVNFSGNGELIFNIDNNSLTTFDTKTRQPASVGALDVKESHGRKTLVEEDGAIYVVDDSAFKKLDYNGRLIGSFRHISALGYDVDGLPGRSYAFFSDGVGVVKIDKKTMKPLDWVFTQNLAEAGGWSIGLKAVEDSGGEKVVVFNNSSLMVLDENLDLIDFFKSNTPELRPIEALGLSADKTRAPGNADISLRGQGFGLNEELEISFGRTKTLHKADENGRFTAILAVPQVLPTRTDIKVTGKTTGLTYSLAFQVE